MARIKGGLNAKKKHNRVLKLAKGYRGARSKQYRVAKQSVMRALATSYAGRKERKRQFRQLWIARINAAARLNGISYSKFMYGLKNAGVDMNRKMLAEMAVNDAEGFATLAELAKANQTPACSGHALSHPWYSRAWKCIPKNTEERHSALLFCAQCLRRDALMGDSRAGAASSSMLDYGCPDM